MHEFLSFLLYIVAGFALGYAFFWIEKDLGGGEEKGEDYKGGAKAGRE